MSSLVQWLYVGELGLSISIRSVSSRIESQHSSVLHLDTGVHLVYMEKLDESSCLKLFPKDIRTSLKDGLLEPAKLSSWPEHM